jgi:hypothetical protein
MALLVPPGKTDMPRAPPAAASVAVAHPSTYPEELFNDETNGPAPSHLQNYLSGYRLDGPRGVPAPPSLQYQTLILSDHQTMAFLCLGPGPGGGAEVTVLHWMMRCVDMPGEVAPGYHDTIIGLRGDIMPHQYPVVAVTSTAFHLAASTPVQVRTTDANTLLPTWEDPVTPLGPFDAEMDPETEVVRPRHMQLVPGYHVALFVHWRGLSAKMPR